jgi:hypothetical protein
MVGFPFFLTAEGTSKSWPIQTQCSFGLIYDKMSENQGIKVWFRDKMTNTHCFSIGVFVEKRHGLSLSPCRQSHL